MSVAPHKHRAVHSACVAINDGLRNREDMRLVEGVVTGRASVSRRSETDALGGKWGVGSTRISACECCRVYVQSDLAAACPRDAILIGNDQLLLGGRARAQPSRTRIL